SRRPVQLFPGDTALCPDGPGCRVDADPLHAGQVDHQAAVRDSQARDAVAASAYGDLSSLLTAEIYRVHDVGNGKAPGDERRMLADQAVMDPAGPFVGRVRRPDQVAGERRSYVVGNPDAAAHPVPPR